MVIIFIILGGFVVQCVFDQDSYCGISDFKTFGTLATAGVLELVYEFKGVIGIWRKRNRKDE